MTNFHKSVLLQEVVDLLKIKPGHKYIDGTLGGGGHSEAILKRGGRVLGIDVDEEAIKYVEKKFRPQTTDFKITKDLVLVRGNFKDIDKIAEKNGFENSDGILLDLGVSSHQFDSGERGFSIQADAMLDMRMDGTLTVTAKDLVNGLSKNELTELFRKYGEERFAPVIARNIVKERQIKPIERTNELVAIIKRSVYLRHEQINPATRVFQALRIAVNDELNNLEEALPKCIQLLAPNGRLIVISFHSLEDRIVKNSFKEFAVNGLGTVLTEKPIMASEDEVQINKRSRSAKLRVFEKI